MKFKAHEFWRDLEAFGSFTFYAAVIARSLIGLNGVFFGQLVASLLVSQIVLMNVGTAMRQKISSHASNGGALIVLINAFYKNIGFALFCIALYVLVCIGHQKLRKHSWIEILTGLAIGLASAGLIWWLTPLVL